MFLATLCWPASAETLIVFGDDAYAPIIFQREGQAAGALVRLLRRAELLTGDRYDVQLVPWKRAYEAARRGEGGLIGVSLNQERAAIFDFSKPVYFDDIRIVTLKGREFVFNQLADLGNKKLGGVLGASYGEAADRAIAAGLFRVDRDIGQVSRLRMLLAGRLDAALIGNGSAGLEVVLESHPELQANRERFAVLDKPLARDPLHLAFAKQMGKLAAIERFNNAVEQLARESTKPPTR